MTKLKTKNKYEEEEFDWGKVSVDTLVEVSDDEVIWYKRHFKKYHPEARNPYEIFSGGRTSKTVIDTCSYKFCRIVEEK